MKNLKNKDKLDEIFSRNFEEYKRTIDRLFGGLSLQLEFILKIMRRIKADTEEIKSFIRTHK